MAKSKKKGYLLDNEKQMESKTLAKLTGSTIEEIESLLGELEAHGVYSKTSEGIIFNRRMVRVVEISKIRSEAGKLGGRPKKQMESKRQSKTKARGKQYVKAKGDQYVKARSASVYASSSLNTDINKEIEEIKRGWNEFAGQHNLATVSKIDQKSERGRHLEARMAEKDWDFKKLLEIIGESSFLLGKKGKEPFFVTFDWLLWSGNYRRTMDGNYKDRVGKDMGGVQEWYEKEKAKEKEEREHE